MPHPISYCHKDDDIKKAVEDVNFCLYEESGRFFLRHDHSYFYQVCMMPIVFSYPKLFYCGSYEYPKFGFCIYMRVQCQLFCRESTMSYCWTKNDLHIERIYSDENLRLENISGVKHFSQSSIVLELIGKFYSRSSEMVCTSKTPLESELSCSSVPGPSTSAPSVEATPDS